MIRNAVVDAQRDAAGIQIETAGIRRISHMIELARAGDERAPAVRSWRRDEFLASLILGSSGACEPGRIVGRIVRRVEAHRAEACYSRPKGRHAHLKVLGVDPGNRISDSARARQLFGADALEIANQFSRISGTERPEQTTCPRIARGAVECFRDREKIPGKAGNIL